MKSPKVLILISNDYSYDQRMRKTALSLVELGFEVEILAQRFSQSKSIDNSDKYALKRLFNPFSKGKMMYLHLGINLLHSLIFNKLEIVLAVDLDTLWVAALIKRFKKFTLIYDAHELYTETPELMHRKLERNIWLGLEKISFAQIDRAYTVSQGYADEYLRRYGKHLEVIENWPLPLNIEIQEQKMPYVLYQGNLNEGRGLEELIEAFAYVHEDLTLKIIGDGPLYEKITSLLSTKPYRSRIELLGFLPYAQILPITSKAYLGINLLHVAAKSYALALPNRLFDYIQCATPSIHSHSPEIERYLQEFPVGSMIKDIKPCSIAKEINFLYENNLIHQTYLKNCIFAREKLLWTKQIKKLSSIFYCE
ncbi:MAG: glycosyltransferase [Chitinophagales bacterium]|jgi:glycosyltransferase involved in cell wall biosynthesis|nr:glycosyltransferase [Chitinophagales bacterium]